MNGYPDDYECDGQEVLNLYPTEQGERKDSGKETGKPGFTADDSPEGHESGGGSEKDGDI